MKHLLEGVIEELKALKSEGERVIPVNTATVDALERSAASAPAVTSVSEPDPVAKSARRGKKPDLPPLPSAPVFELPEGSKDERYAWLKDKVLNCEECNSHVKPGKHVVIGSGNLDSPIFFCGEAPGAEEEEQGEVFVGPAGQLLVKVINAMGLAREDVYIGNIMNWRPEVEYGNRPPTEDEMRFCMPYLRAQLEIVQPQVVVALGRTAVDGLLGPDPGRRMGKIRGKWHSFEDRPLMITFHPSYVLRNSTLATKRQVWEDMMQVMEKVGMTISDKQRGFFRK